MTFRVSVRNSAWSRVCFVSKRLAIAFQAGRSLLTALLAARQVEQLIKTGGCFVLFVKTTTNEKQPMKGSEAYPVMCRHHISYNKHAQMS